MAGTDHDPVTTTFSAKLDQILAEIAIINSRLDDHDVRIARVEATFGKQAAIAGGDGLMAPAGLMTAMETKLSLPLPPPALPAVEAPPAPRQLAPSSAVVAVDFAPQTTASSTTPRPSSAPLQQLSATQSEPSKVLSFTGASSTCLLISALAMAGGDRGAPFSIQEPITIKEGKDKCCLFPWEPGGTSVHHLKVEGYKEFAACIGSDLPWLHLAMQTNKAIALEVAEANQGTLACIHAGVACTLGGYCFAVEKKEETNPCVLQPHIHLFPCTRKCMLACSQFSGVTSICMLMDEKIKGTVNEGNQYMTGLFPWDPGGRRNKCFFPWEPGRSCAQVLQWKKAIPRCVHGFWHSSGTPGKQQPV